MSRQHARWKLKILLVSKLYLLYLHTHTHTHTHTHNLLTNSCMIETYDDLVTLIGRKLRQRVHDYIWLVEKSNNDDNLMVAFETWLISDKKIQLFFCHYKTFTAFRL
jgi:hypothetical protein